MKIIAIDFDGTIVVKNDDVFSTDFVLLPNAKEVVTWIRDNFYTILWTSRSGEVLQNALDFIGTEGLSLHNVNQNAPFLDFETSNKIYADLYVDDHNGIPVDWLRIQNFLQSQISDEEIIVDKVIADVDISYVKVL